MRASATKGTSGPLALFGQDQVDADVVLRGKVVVVNLIDQLFAPEQGLFREYSFRGFPKPAQSASGGQ